MKIAFHDPRIYASVKKDLHASEALKARTMAGKGLKSDDIFQ